MALFKTLFKFTIGLLYQLHQVNICHLQLQVSGTCLGSFHQIFRQCF